jgi:hypothetical protein
VHAVGRLGFDPVALELGLELGDRFLETLAGALDERRHGGRMFIRTRRGWKGR